MKVALIGTGMVAATHIAALQESGSVHLRGVLGRTPERTRAFIAAQNLDVVCYGSIDELVADPALNFVILVTPPDARAEYIAALTKAKMPILMEKPVERTLKASQAIVRMADVANVPLGIVFQHRARAASLALKQAIESGKLGAISHVDIRVPWWREQSYYDAPGRGTYDRDGGGVLITQAIHSLDLALWCAGPVSKVQALIHQTTLHDLEAEDWASALLRFESGAVGTLMATTAAYPGQSESVSIQGEKAFAHLESGVLKLSFLDGTDEVIGETSATGGGADPMAFTHAWHQTVIEDFAHALATKAACLAPGQEALRAHAVIAAMEKASKSGQIEEVVAT